MLGFSVLLLLYTWYFINEWESKTQVRLFWFSKCDKCRRKWYLESLRVYNDEKKNVNSKHQLMSNDVIVHLSLPVLGWWVELHKVYFTFPGDRGKRVGAILNDSGVLHYWIKLTCVPSTILLIKLIKTNCYNNQI